MKKCGHTEEQWNESHRPSITYSGISTKQVPSKITSSIFTYLGEYSSLFLFKWRNHKAGILERDGFSKTTSLSKDFRVGYAIWGNMLFDYI